MSPEERLVHTAVSRALRRTLVLTALEAASFGAAVGVWSVWSGLAVSLVWASFLSARGDRRSVVRRLDRAMGARNLVVTADELGDDALRTTSAIRARVFADAADRLQRVDVGRALPARRTYLFAVGACAIWMVAGVYHARRPLPASTDRATGAAIAQAGVSAPIQITASVTPPSYTHMRSKTTENPQEIEAIEHSDLELTIRTAADSLTVDRNGDTVHLTPTSGEFRYRTVLRTSGFLVISADADRRRTIPVTVVPDALPAVRIVVPGRDLVYSGGNPRIEFHADATDDFGLKSMTLRYTKVSGSGETFAFSDGEIPLDVTAANDRAWQGVATRTLAELHLQDGDMLVYRAAARDGRPGDIEAASDAYFIEISKLGAAAGDAFTLPEQETRYALSQQMLIIKTERLNARAARMPAVELLEESQNLAVEQRMIRSEFVFMLGGEVEDEEIEAEQSTELQEGRLANRGQRDLRAATVAMSQAQALLTGGRTSEALTSERAAVIALQRAFARDRYILRALAGRTQLDESRRLSVAMTETLGWHRGLLAVPENRRAVQVQGLMQSLGDAFAGVLRDDGGRQLAALAELAIRIDAHSARWRNAAAQLQRLADTWSSLGANSRVASLGAIAALLVEEMRAAVADAPLRLNELSIDRGGAR